MITLYFHTSDYYGNVYKKEKDIIMVNLMEDANTIRNFIAQLPAFDNVETIRINSMLEESVIDHYKYRIEEYILDAIHLINPVNVMVINRMNGVLNFFIANLCVNVLMNHVCSVKNLNIKTSRNIFNENTYYPDYVIKYEFTDYFDRYLDVNLIMSLYYSSGIKTYLVDDDDNAFPIYNITYSSTKSARLRNPMTTPMTRTRTSKTSNFGIISKTKKLSLRLKKLRKKKSKNS